MMMYYLPRVTAYLCKKVISNVVGMCKEFTTKIVASILLYNIGKSIQWVGANMNIKLLSTISRAYSYFCPFEDSALKKHGLSLGLNVQNISSDKKKVIDHITRQWISLITRFVFAHTNRFCIYKM